MLATALQNVPTNRTITFAFYNGEEEGALASAPHANQFKAEGKQGPRVMGFDMVGLSWPVATPEADSTCLCTWFGYEDDALRGPAAPRQLQRARLPRRGGEGPGRRPQRPQLRRGVLGRRGLPDPALGRHAHRLRHTPPTTCLTTRSRRWTRSPAGARSSSRACATRSCRPTCTALALDNEMPTVAGPPRRAARATRSASTPPARPTPTGLRSEFTLGLRRRHLGLRGDGRAHLRQARHLHRPARRRRQPLAAGLRLRPHDGHRPRDGREEAEAQALLQVQGAQDQEQEEARAGAEEVRAREEEAALTATG